MAELCSTPWLIKAVCGTKLHEVCGAGLLAPYPNRVEKQCNVLKIQCASLIYGMSILDLAKIDLASLILLYFKSESHGKATALVDFATVPGRITTWLP